MLVSNVIGNLAADAEVKEANGKKFVSFTVYHSEKFTTASGEQKERTQRVSCALNGDGGSLLQYLKKGVKVFVSGRSELRTYSSPTQRAIVAGLNLSVDRVELCGGSSEDVPRELVVPDSGLVLPVKKAYFIPLDELKKNGEPKVLYSLYGGSMFNVDNNGFVYPATNQQQAEAEATEANNNPA